MLTSILVLPLQDTLAKLFSFSLIARKRINKYFSIHPLVHSWARERLDQPTKGEMARTALRMVCASLKSWEIWTTGIREPQDWQYERLVATHLTTVLRLCEKESPIALYADLSPEVVKLAHTYFYAGDYAAADQLYSLIIAKAKETLQPNDPDYLRLAHGSATVKRFIGSAQEPACQALYESVLEERRKLDVDGLDTLATVQSLAVLYRHQGRLVKAVELYEWALYGFNGTNTGFEAQQGAEHPNTVHTRLGYAIVLQHQGKYQQAQQRYRQVLSYRTLHLGEEHLDTLTVKQNLADVLRRVGDLSSAEIIFGEVLDAREKWCGPTHPDTLRTADGLANVYRDQRQFEKSDKLYQQALQGRKQYLGPEHPDTLATMHNIAESHILQSDLGKAKRLLETVLQGRIGYLRAGHLDTLRTKKALGDIALRENELQLADTLYSEVVSGFEQQMPQDCLDVIQATTLLEHTRSRRGLESTEGIEGPDSSPA
jgi:tetratricopeptide (TPR) repeat protein